MPSRIAVVSDLHGNLTALEAVIEDLSNRCVHEVVHGGDLVLMGARPADVLDRIRELGWRGVVGNTDELLWRPEMLEAQLDASPKLEPLLRTLFMRYAPFTVERLGRERLDWLTTLPRKLSVGDTTVVHATSKDLWRAPARDAQTDELDEAFADLEGTRAVYGHIHRPYIRRTARRVVANAGSVGMPWNGDPHASYVLIDAGQAELIRVGYDIEAEVEALNASGHPDQQRIAAMLRHGRFVPVPPEGE